MTPSERFIKSFKLRLGYVINKHIAMFDLDDRDKAIIARIKLEKWVEDEVGILAAARKAKAND